MYIKRVVIEGFKSYGTRTEINGFDPQFNAITGLNGTGKSNILDSICFVLGISNLTQVRANSLNELIYKSGQAGVTKASVTVFFDNSNPNQSPINYEQQKEISVCRQIFVGGKNRYFINGTTVPSRVLIDFFNSVQLNVNNPHFLIMQGRITKVLNMKPPEILAMIQEAAGTKMYENKKTGAQKTLEKKEKKIFEMEDIIVDQINPSLEKQKKDRQQYAEYQKLTRELAHWSKVLVAWEFTRTEEKRTQYEVNVEKGQDLVKRLEDSLKDSQTEIATIEENLAIKQRIRDEEGGGLLKKLEAELKAKETAEIKASVQMKSVEESRDAELKELKQLEKTVASDKKTLDAKKAEVGNTQTFEGLRLAEVHDKEALAAAQQRFQAVSCGLLSNDEGESGSLQNQLMSAKQQMTDAGTEIRLCTIDIDKFKEELAKKKPQLESTQHAFVKDRKEVETHERKLNSLKAEMGKINYEDGRLEDLQNQEAGLKSDIARYTDTVNEFEARYPHLSFNYQDPEPNFNRSKVRGLLCKLFKVKDQAFARAIEAVAGGRLYNVVVDDDAVSTKLIKNGRLAKRVTFAPLDKMKGYKMPVRVFQKAQNLVGPENVFLAQSLIEYDPEYESVMTWVFGDTLICTTTEAAKEVCFNRDVQKRSITVDGASFDPAGIISGGAVAKTQPILMVLNQVVTAEQERHTKMKELNQVKLKIQQIASTAHKYNQLKQDFEYSTRELKMIQNRIEQSTHHQLKKEIDNLEEEIKNRESRMVQSKEIIKEREAKIKELVPKLNDIESYRKNAIKEAEAELKKCKEKAELSRKKWQEKEQAFSVLTLEIQQLEKSIEQDERQIITLKENISRFENEVASLKEASVDVHVAVQEMKARVKAHVDTIHAKDQEIQNLLTSKEQITKRIADIDLQLISERHTLAKMTSDLATSKEVLERLLENNPWIETEKYSFGQQSGIYDFDKHDCRTLKDRVRAMNEKKETMGRSINPDLVAEETDAEENYTRVLYRKTIIQDDCVKIRNAMTKLDVKKIEMVQKAWEVVNKDFHSILSTLLPGAKAQLRPVDQNDIMKGLAVVVGFGGLWKEGLDELSGGQRSLVALSLVLAMLRFKPAPLYILDEVDAALDPSHTQNIGQMLKAHFTQSQFIVVSLKEGMFNNANVLFTTCFIDGMSGVNRTTNTGN